MTAAKILIVEDDPALNGQIAELLQNQGFDIEQAYDGEEGLLMAISESFDLILLDVMLPHRDGFSVLQHLRQSHQTPVIMITAKDAEEERILGFSKGADDYLPKPFNLTELTLRIEAILRRSLGLSVKKTEALQFEQDGLVLNRQEQRVYFDGQEIQLTPIQFRLLWTLAQHPNEVLSKPLLYQQVLERKFSRYDRSLDMHLSRVRRKLTEAGMAVDRLQTVHGTGYSLS